MNAKKSKAQRKKMQNLSRRCFLKKSALGALGGLAAAGSALPPWSGAQQEQPPNIVLFLADDTGWNDVGYHGSEIETPTIDRLAQEGVELDQFYAYPTCSPSRAALMSGRPPSRYGILGPILGNSRLAIPPDTPTLANVLGSRGYQTAITGKWHLGLQPRVGPWNYGFDYSYGSLHGQIDPYTHRYKYGDATWHRNGDFIQEAGHATDLIAREAQRYITEIRNPSRPFFLYTSFTVPHYPLHEPREYIDRYSDAIDNPDRRRFAASMTHMDAAFGRIMSTLEEQGLAENTLIIFASDNGGQESWDSPEDQYVGRYDDHEQLGSNRPLRGWKTEVYEGGIRVPAAAYWPGRLESSTASEPMIMYDVLPTLANLTGADTPSEVEGTDVWSALSGGASLPERALYWRVPTAMALRQGDWKLVHLGPTLEEGDTELYNLAEDPDESNNLAGERPEKLAALRKELATHADDDQLLGAPEDYYEWK